MNEALLLMGIVILICILLNRFLEKIPIPSLLIFIMLGICFGENGILKIQFDNYEAVNVICSICLIFIMFYGGFGTNIKTARPILAPAIAMSTLGVVGTAGLMTLFAHFILNLSLSESFLIGSVISSTDAASVFNILRSKNLALKYNTDSLLEVESGSNDPISYMLTTLAVLILSGKSLSVPSLLMQQIFIGSLCGFLIGFFAVKLLHKQIFLSQQSHTVFLLSIMLLAYALPSVMKGNGYLSVYLCGIYIGNSNLIHKKYMVHFFDVLTDVSQVQIFFLLGLLVTPVELPSVILPTLILMVGLTFLIRPILSLILLLPFKARIGQIGIVSWAGLRGVASIVFAISAVLSGAHTTYNLYNLVFCMVLLSISFQGTLLPIIADKFNMIDKKANLARTFTDYQEDTDVSFFKLHISANSMWCNKRLMDLQFPPELLVVMIIRNREVIVPTGSSIIKEGDLAVLAARTFEDRENLSLREIVVEKGKPYSNCALSELPPEYKNRVILIKRGLMTIIPDGDTVIKPEDVLVMIQD